MNLPPCTADLGRFVECLDPMPTAFVTPVDALVMLIGFVMIGIVVTYIRQGLRQGLTWR